MRRNTTAVASRRGDPAGGPAVDVSKLDDTQIGGLARFGLEYDFTTNLALDVHGSYEVFEFPAGTNASILGGAAAVIRF